MIKTQKQALLKRNIKLGSSVMDRSPTLSTLNVQVKQNQYDMAGTRNMSQKAIEAQSFMKTRKFAELNLNTLICGRKKQLEYGMNKTTIIDTTSQLQSNRKILYNNEEAQNIKRQKLSRSITPVKNKNIKSQRQIRSAGKLLHQLTTPKKINQKQTNEVHKYSHPQIAIISISSITQQKQQTTVSQTQFSIKLPNQSSIQCSKGRIKSTSRSRGQAKHAYCHQNSVEGNEQRIQIYAQKKERQIQYKMQNQKINNMHREISSMLNMVYNKQYQKDNTFTQQNYQTFKMQIANQKQPEDIKQRQAIYKQQRKDISLKKQYMALKQQNSLVQQLSKQYSRQKSNRASNRSILNQTKLLTQKNNKNNDGNLNKKDKSPKKFDYTCKFSKVSEVSEFNGQENQGKINDNYNINNRRLNQQELNKSIKQLQIKYRQQAVRKIQNRNYEKQILRNNRPPFTKSIEEGEQNGNTHATIYNKNIQGRYTKANALFSGTSAVDKQIYEDYLRKYKKMATSFSKSNIQNDYQNPKYSQNEVNKKSKPQNSSYAMYRDQALLNDQKNSRNQNSQQKHKLKYVYQVQTPKTDKNRIMLIEDKITEQDNINYSSQQENVCQQPTIKLNQARKNSYYEVNEQQNIKDCNQTYEQNFNEIDSSYIDLIDQQIYKIKQRIQSSQLTTKQMQSKYLNISSSGARSKQNPCHESQQYQQRYQNQRSFQAHLQQQQSYKRNLTFKQKKYQNESIVKPLSSKLQQDIAILRQTQLHDKNHEEDKNRHKNNSNIQNKMILGREQLQQKQRQSIERQILCRKVAAVFSKQIQIDNKMKAYREIMSRGTTQYNANKLWQQLTSQLKRYGRFYQQQQLRQLLEISSSQSNPFQLLKQSKLQANSSNAICSLTDIFMQSQAHWQNKIKKCLQHQQPSMNNIYLPSSMDLNQKGYVNIEDLVCFVNLYADKFYRNRDLIMFAKRIKREKSQKSGDNSFRNRIKEVAQIQYQEIQSIVYGSNAGQAK